MSDEYGHIELSREQFRELLQTLVIGMHVRRHAAGLKEDGVADEDLTAAEEMEHYLLSLASGFEAEDLVERSEDNLVPSRLAEDFCHAVIDEHDNERFWDRLENELAERDFLAALPPEERIIVEETHMFPKGIEAYYKKYRKEFDDHGTDRLGIREGKEEKNKK